jgi:hypothetical protein
MGQNATTVVFYSLPGRDRMGAYAMRSCRVEEDAWGRTELVRHHQYTLFESEAIDSMRLLLLFF